MIRFVAPFRPFPPESDLHKTFAGFDWIDAIRMLQVSAEQTHPGVPFHVLTDVETELPLPMLRYRTTRRRLMLWTLEACLRYLESDDFDRDTVMLDCDQLLYGDLSRLAVQNCDLVICIRPADKQRQNPDAMPILNGVQVWMHRGKKRLIRFYREALAIAEGLPEDRIIWGADTDALEALLSPIERGRYQRSGLDIHMLNAPTVLVPFSNAMKQWVREGRPFHPGASVVDFRWTRKPFMRPMFEHTYGRMVLA